MPFVWSLQGLYPFLKNNFPGFSLGYFLDLDLFFFKIRKIHMNLKIFRNNHFYHDLQSQTDKWWEFERICMKNNNKFDWKELSIHGNSMVNSGLCGIFSETCRGHGSECSTYRDSVSYWGQRIKQFLPNQAYKHLSIDTSHKDVGPVCIILKIAQCGMLSVQVQKSHRISLWSNVLFAYFLVDWPILVQVMLRLRERS